jgi:antitoxin VapB
VGARHRLKAIDRSGIYQWYLPSETDVTTAKLFKSGRSQAVRLPKEFRFEGNEVRIRRVGQGVLLEPMKPDLEKLFEELDRIGRRSKFPDRPPQPPIQERDFDFD